ncbi:BZ3500_MvSof-1268-A1-R1_Chr3-1g05494 [Microbotryum saponariae]|uniref:BZ3500_MvSof-1268-A1-R1_Chr3-1g05494 protein n=1 Tax=Microbotryum saponariae TaxID=289078 RepID=A0A2X0M643_9BASI|nr:BZ3500_MvSof-1268-A1-R1_Chr3-1g05494 [Microbotryum saponariae]SDA04685.1 BZ3501_MvSof-1269-A2-R1_Chr3-1g05165 [Microbotryum saponariae]
MAAATPRRSSTSPAKPKSSSTKSKAAPVKTKTTPTRNASVRAKAVPKKASTAGKGKGRGKGRKRLDSRELDEPTETESSDDDDDDEDEEDDDGSDFAGEDSEQSSLSAAGDSDRGDSDDDDEDEDEESEDDAANGKKRRKSGGGSASKKNKRNGKGGDDLNLRVIKKQKAIPGSTEDPETHIVLPSTMDFLTRLKENNDRDWFKARDAQYRHALKNIQSLCQAWVPRAAQADWSLPEMPVKDLMQRIHRDVRFSKSKIPYRTCLAFSHSRTGRKGPFAIYYLQIGPHGQSLLAGGLWAPDGDQVKMIRNGVLRDAAPLRKILNNPKFIKYFGKPDHKSGKRTSIYGHEDQLKNCPKMDGVTKDHPEIDLLKLRSNAVTHYFTDDEVLSEGFLDKVIDIMEVMAPFVQLLNDVSEVNFPLARFGLSPLPRTTKMKMKIKIKIKATMKTSKRRKEKKKKTRTKNERREPLSFNSTGILAAALF